MTGLEVIGAMSASLQLLDAANGTISKTIKSLKRFRNAPPELQDLLEHVDILSAVASAVVDASLINTAPPGLVDLLNRLKKQLLELQRLIQFQLVKASEKLEVNRFAWVRRKTEITSRLDAIQQTTNYISPILTATTVVQTAEVQRQMQTVALQTTNLVGREPAMVSLTSKVDALTLICERMQSSTATMDQIQSLLEPLQQSALHASQASTSQQVVPLQQSNSASATGALRPCSIPDELMSMRLASAPAPPGCCPKACRCRCHKRKSLSLPSSLRSLIGTLQITIVSPRLRWASCTVASCQRKSNVSATLQYAFPPWIAATMISAWYRGSPAGSVDRLLRVVNIVRSNAYYYAIKGDLISLRNLYVRGEASIYDVNPIENSTALSFAIMYGQYDVARFLLANGADPMQQDMSGIDAQINAMEIYFDPDQKIDEIAALFSLNDIIETQDFTSVHRIILGLSSRDLADELQEHPELLDAVDASGRTPIYWAIWRDDLEAIRNLLRLGARVDVVASDGFNIFHIVATSQFGHEIFSLIEKYIPQQLLSTECLASQLNTRSVDGKPTWRLVIVNNDVTLLQKFLKYNLDLSVADAWGHTLFHTASMYAKAEMLRFLSTVNLNGVDLMGVNVYGSTAMMYIVARLRDDVFWTKAPVSSEEDAEALVRLVAHARTFEPRLPRIIFGFRRRGEGGDEEQNGEDEEVEKEDGEDREEEKYGEEHKEEYKKKYKEEYEEEYEQEYDGEWPDYGLFSPLDGKTNVSDEWSKWVDVEDWLAEHGHLNMDQAFIIGSTNDLDSGDEIFADATDQSATSVPLNTEISIDSDRMKHSSTQAIVCDT